MKAICLILVALFLSGAAASSGSLTPSANSIHDAEVPPMECTFTIKGTFNGTVVNVQITVSDVNFVECTVLKLGVKKAIQ